MKRKELNFVEAYKAFTAGKQSQGTADKQKKEREICFIH